MISAAVIVGEISAIASEVTSEKLRHPFLREPVDSAFIDRFPPNHIGRAAPFSSVAVEQVKITCQATMQLGCLLGNSSTCEASSSKSTKRLTGWQRDSQLPSIKAAACRDADVRAPNVPGRD